MASAKAEAILSFGTVLPMGGNPLNRMSECGCPPAAPAFRRTRRLCDAGTALNRLRFMNLLRTALPRGNCLARCIDSGWTGLPGLRRTGRSDLHRPVALLLAQFLSESKPKSREWQCATPCFVAYPTGFEPAASRVGVLRSIQLGYG